MSENKFIKHLKGEDTAKSVLEIKNESTKTSFANIPSDTSNPNVKYSDSRGDATAVLKGTDNWKLSDSILALATTVYGDGRDLTGSYSVSGNTTWVNAVYTFTADKIFTAGTKWVLKLCGHSLVSEIANTIDFSLLIKFNNQYIITKSFTVKENAFDFCQEFVVDFSESEQNVIKMANADTLTVQLLCADATASATIYNGMTVLTALQRRVDGDAVASDTYTFDELVEDLTTHIANKNNPHEVTKAQVGLGNCDNTSDLDKPISTATQTALNAKVNIDGTSIMTAPLKFMSGSMRGAVGPYLNGVSFWKTDAQGTLTNIANLTDSRFLPVTTNAIDLGRSANTWKDLYLGGKAYVATINNGADLSVPNKSGTLATTADVELAARSGRMLTDQGVWYAKMYSATVAPAAEDDTNYADFSQVDGDNNPIIVIYTRTSGAWVQSETITPPAEYDGYVPITSKIWDITEQAGQQGGRILWNHQSKEFTPYPQIISFEDIEVTGDSTVIMPATPTDNSIVNKKYVDDATANSGSGLNVGDIFLTMRNDNELNGAVECDGSTYNTTDFTGAQSIGQLLEDGKVPYVSMAVYATTIATQGWCDKFGWDGTGNVQFKVPTLSAYVWQKLQVGIKGSIGSGSGGTYFVATQSNFTQYTHPDAGAYGVTVSNDQTIPGASVDITSEDVSQQRCMVQLATSATDEAVITCTNVMAQVAANTSAINGADYVVESQLPTAENNYTWYRKYKSGWVEQGGILSVSSESQATATLPVTMSNTNYTITNGFQDQNNTKRDNPITILEVTTTSIRMGHKAGSTMKCHWEVSGIAA